MISALRKADLSGKTVFLRADLNVPLIDGAIINDFRLRALQPTLDLLVDKQAKIILATHRGRPLGIEKELSTEYLMQWFANHEYSVTFAPTLQEAQRLVDTMAPGTIILLENLRFFKEERSGSEKEPQTYAEKLRSLAEYYVNDAWALLHKDDTSIALLPQLFTDKTIGLLIEKELKELGKLREPKHPFVMILGGAKLSKIATILKALEIADTIIVLPALASTFLKAQGIPIGDSLVDDTLLAQAKEILALAKQRSVKLVLPVDYLIGTRDLRGPLTISQEIPEGKIAIAVGPASLERYYGIINDAQMVFYNGAMGFFERAETLEPLKKLLQSVAQANAYSVVGGGESVAAANLFDLEDDISFLSTGGGSTLYYIVHGTLPGLEHL